MSSIRTITSLVLFCSIAISGCTVDSPLNPAFPLKYAEAREALASMKEQPRKPVRPIIVASGIHDPGLISGQLARDLHELLHPDAEVVHVTFFGANTFDDCRHRMIESLEEAFPSACDEATIEVDVVGFSMGGLVARYAALPRDDGKRLRIVQLFTISTPHQGANWANWPTFDSRVRKMRRGSDFLKRLDHHLEEAPYELVCYVRRSDAVVGLENAAPRDREVIWVANRPLTPAHVGAGRDARLLADIARRLRQEPSYVQQHPACTETVE